MDHLEIFMLLHCTKMDGCNCLKVLNSIEHWGKLFLHIKKYIISLTELYNILKKWKYHIR